MGYISHIKYAVLRVSRRRNSELSLCALLSRVVDEMFIGACLLQETSPAIKNFEESNSLYKISYATFGFSC